MSLDVKAVIDEVHAVLLQSVDQPYIGEPISQLEHALQCGSLAEDAGADDELVLAAWLHDMGHLVDPNAPTMEGLGVLHHEDLGAEWLLQRGFSPRVAALVASHVPAKRYLVARRAAYRERLSEASLGTLAFQGGAMSDAEALAFEQRPDIHDALRLRAWDEAAKVVDAVTPGLEHFLTLARRHLTQNETR